MTSPTRRGILAALGAIERLMEHSAGARDLFLAATVGIVIALGTLITAQQSRPTEVAVIDLPPVDLVALSGCDTSAGIGASWDVDASGAGLPTVAGITLSGVPADCAALPITVSILDGNAASIASVTQPAVVPDATTMTLAFSFSPGVDIPAIEGLKAEIPDPMGLPVPVPTGADAAVSFIDPTSGIATAIRFGSVAQAGGSVTATVLAAGMEGYVPPSGFGLTSPAVYFDVSSDAVFSGSAEVCLFYPSGSAPAGGSPRLYHYDPGLLQWADVTTSWDSATGRLCGSVSHFSPFAVGTSTTTKTTMAANPLSVPWGGTTGGAATVQVTAVGLSSLEDPSGTVDFGYCVVASVSDLCSAGSTSFASGDLAPESGALVARFADWSVPTSLGLGYVRLTATYPGDATYLPSDDTTSSGAVFQVVAAPTTTSLQLDASTAGSVYQSITGQVVRLTGRVAPQLQGAPAGSLDFYDSNSPTQGSFLGSCTLAAGTCDLTTGAFTKVGAHNVIAVYRPAGGNATDGFFTSSQAGAVRLDVAKASTTTAVAIGNATQVDASTYTAPSGVQLRITATVRPTLPGRGTPGGSVSFLDAGRKIGSCQLSASTGSASCSMLTSSLSAAAHPITATYAGDTTMNGSTSSAATITVGGRIDTTTGMYIGTSASSTTPTGSSLYGKTVYLIATVTPRVASGKTPTGTVTFRELTNGTLAGSTVVGTCKLTTSKGVTSCSYASKTLKVGGHVYVAVYPGDTGFNASASDQYGFQIQRAGTFASVTTTSSSLKYGSSTVLTALVTPIDGGTAVPTGYVTFWDNGKQLATFRLSSGVYRYAIGMLSRGTHTFAVTYSGDANFLSTADTPSLMASSGVVIWVR